MSNFQILSESLDNAELLKKLHHAIDEYRLPITSKDDLNSQIVEIEKYLGGNEFSNLNAKTKFANLGTGLLGLPVLIYCLFLFGSRYANSFGFNIDAAAFNHSLFMLVINYLWILIIYALLFIGLVAYFYKLNKQVKAKIYSIVNKLFTILN
ncbi:hypothetical protein B9T31_12210 [Acinetobacter sp. ANC 4558]|uniref:DUF6097 family protein n=1 Tax=Acinetobacter sp. ANC 4558 TaxID=1977876 RepID=UPI000A3514DC|nr:DUF6097 family protein [Acinetobacter sp. ANC 4558]OTG85547.1 hypothetical protein B9T31_12210 [Acinetobacter sp. ANC 4558]